MGLRAAKLWLWAELDGVRLALKRIFGGRPKPVVSETSPSAEATMPLGTVRTDER